MITLWFVYILSAGQEFFLPKPFQNESDCKTAIEQIQPQLPARRMSCVHITSYWP